MDQVADELGIGVLRLHGSAPSLAAGGRRDVSRATGARLAAGLLLLAVAGCGGSGGLPVGYHLFRDAGLGFQVGLATGWTVTGREAEGVDFADAGRTSTLLVHVEEARSTDPAAEADAIVSRLAGFDRPAASATTLSGLPGLRLRGETVAAPLTEDVDAVVALQGGRAWAVVLQAPPGSRAPFDSMLATFSLLEHRPGGNAHASVGAPAPHFSELDSIRGPVVLNFFATWCGPCRAEMPMLARQAEQAGGRFTVLAVDSRDDPGQVPAFARRLGLDVPFAYDRDGTLSAAYGVVGLPSTFFLDAHHVVRALVLGSLSPASMAAGLRSSGAALLSSPTPSPPTR
jgi:thiol-disulfide isomerase/thioredoxin